MRIGQRTLLFGAHQFLLHPLLVLLAWLRLFGRPTFKELVCIAVHDLGYWWTTDIDGPTGSAHPEYGAALAARWFGPEYRDLVLYHSRTYAAQAGREPSKLCWADKLSLTYEPWWLYLPRAWASGELAEYRRVAAEDGMVPVEAGHREWLRVVRRILIEQVNREIRKSSKRDLKRRIIV